MEKSGDDVLAWTDNKHKYRIYESPEDSAWAEYDVFDDVFWIDAAYGEKNVNRHWKVIKAMAKVLGCKKIQFITKRSPKAFEKRFGFKTIQYKMEYELD